jgi:hypothetical protein
MHGGSIAVESKVGAGTTFRFHFPAVPRTRESSQVLQAPAVRPKSVAPGADPLADDPDEEEVVVQLPPGDPLRDDPDEDES